MLKKLYQWIRKIVHVTKFTYFVRFLWSILPVSWPIKPKRATHLLTFSLYSLMRQQRYAVAGHGGRAGMSRQDEQ